MGIQTCADEEWLVAEVERLRDQLEAVNKAADALAQHGFGGDGYPTVGRKYLDLVLAFRHAQGRTMDELDPTEASDDEGDGYFDHDYLDGNFPPTEASDES